MNALARILPRFPTVGLLTVALCLGTVGADGVIGGEAKPAGAVHGSTTFAELSRGPVRALESSDQPAGRNYEQFAGYILPVHSLDDLLSDSHAVVVARAGEQIGHYWPPGIAATFVHSQFEMEVVESLAGGLPAGTTFVLHVPGGTMAKWGNPQPGGSFRPVEGEETIEVEYAEFPFPATGGVELIFLSRITASDGTEFWLQRHPQGRFDVRHDGSLASVLKRSGARSDDFERWLVGSTVEEARARLAAVLAE